LEGKRSFSYLSPYIKKLASELYVLAEECLWMEKITHGKTKIK